MWQAGTHSGLIKYILVSKIRRLSHTTCSDLWDWCIKMVLGKERRRRITSLLCILDCIQVPLLGRAYFCHLIISPVPRQLQHWRIFPWQPINRSFFPSCQLNQRRFCITGNVEVITSVYLEASLSEMWISICILNSSLDIIVQGMVCCAK